MPSGWDKMDGVTPVNDPSGRAGGWWKTS
jgi:hypothetical protein